MSIKGTKDLFMNNSNLMLLALCFALSNGQLNSFAAIQQDLFGVFGITPAEFAKMSVIFTFVGFAASIAAARFIDRTGRYRLAQLLALCLIFGCMTGMILVCHYFYNKMTLFVIIIAYCAFEMALIPIGFQYGLELSFPVHPSVVQGALVGFMSISNAAQMFIYSSMFAIDSDESNPDEEVEAQKNNSIYVLIVQTSIVLVSLVFACRIRQDLKRRKATKPEEVK